MDFPATASAACRLLLGAGAALVFCTTTSAQITIDPEDCFLTLDPGVLASIDLEVCLQGVEVTEADIYLLADNTESMGTVLANVKAGAALITSTLLNDPNIDIRIGVGSYNDFPLTQPSLFSHQLSISNNEAAITQAINDWVNMGGGDVSESQFYALHRLSIDPAIGFRPNAKRIIVWFGDSPAHDPICAPIVGLFESPAVVVDEASVIAELQAAGQDGTTVIAISTPFSLQIPDALNNDPLGPGNILALDYINLGCPQTGTAGQADRITAATAGISIQISTPQAIVDAILDAIESVLSEVTIEAVPFGEIADFVNLVTPVEFTVQLPNNITKQECVTFQLDFEGRDCAENQSTFTGGIDILVNGQLAATKNVSIDQPLCNESMCLLYLGVTPVALPIQGGGPEDMLYTLPVLVWPVLLEDVPSFSIPNDPAFHGLRVYLQVAMNNPFDFPGDPIKVSQGLEVILGHGSAPYGKPAGMAVFLKQPPLLGGTFEPGFFISGF
jgi:hypothetical protein